MINYKIVFLVLFMSTSQVNAVTFSGNTAGLFGNDSTLLEWGVGFGGSSSLLYESADTFSEDDGIPFKIATLTYNNTEITPDSDFAATFLEPTLHATVIIGSGISSGETSVILGGASIVDADLTIIETDNNSSNPSDTVSLLLSDEDISVFSLNGADYTFKLLGFKNSSGDFDNFFIQPENSNSPVDLYAEITAVPIPSAVWLFITAFTGLLALNNRRAV